MMRLGTLVMILGCLGAALPARSEPDLIFTFPDCIPNCTREDLRANLQQSKDEEAIIRAIDAANDKISFAMYTFSRKPIFEALVRAVNERGVRLQGIVDSAQLASLKPYCSNGLCKFGAPFDEPTYRSRPLTERLAQIAALPLYQKASIAGKLKLLFYGEGERVKIVSPAGSQRLMHHKYLLVDDKQLWTGSGNWSSTAFSVNFENTALWQAKTPEDKDIVTSFVCISNLLASAPQGGLISKVAACSKDPRVYFTPTRSGDEGIASRILEAIKEAKSTIAVSMHHLVYDPIFTALKAASSRGVSIQILFDDDDCMHSTPAGIKELQSLPLQQVEVRYLPTTCSLFQFSHNKYGIFDGHLVINGSANWSKAGLIRNYENFIAYSSPQALAAFKANFAALWAYARPKPACGCNLRDQSCREKFCIGRPRP